MFTLSIQGGSSGSFAAFGVESAILELSNQGMDKLQLGLINEAALDLFPPNAAVTLAHNGVIRFKGWIDNLPTNISGEKATAAVVVNGPWRWLDMTTYSDIATVIDSSSTNGVNSAAPIQVPWLNCGGVDPNTGLALKNTLRQTISAALSQVTTKHPGILGFSMSGGTLDLQIPWSEKQNVGCGSVIRDQLGWGPDHSLVWDYSGGGANLIVVPPSSAVRQVSETGANVSSMALNPRFDLLVNSVVITYLWTDDQGNRYIKRDTSSGIGDAASLNAATGLEMTFALQTNEPAPDSGLAGAYHAAVAKLAVESSFSFFDETFSWNSTPGQTWGFSGVASRWSRYNSVAQVITRNLFSSQITIKLGHPGHLGLQQLINLHRKNIPQAGGQGGGQKPKKTTSNSGGAPLQLVLLSGENYFRVVAGTVGGGSITDLGFHLGDAPIFKLPLMTGILEAKITVDQSSGAIIARALQFVQNPSADTATEYHVQIGSVANSIDGSWSLSQARNGPINVQICRNWFAASAPFYGVTWL